MAKAVVSLVGRPNVGKSTLFNRLVQKREAITEDIPGVTRDRLYREVEWLNRYFNLVDTGGYDSDSSDTIGENIRKQVGIAVESSDLVLFVVDGRVGITAEDREIASLLQKSGKKVLVVINKIDTSETPDTVYEFYELGFDKLSVISAEQSLGLGDLLDDILEFLPEEFTQKEDGDITISIIGKPNAGKSSLLNRLLGEERMIVTDIAGTTRDAIDSKIERNGLVYTFIDTAGLRRKRSVKRGVESYSVSRTLNAIDRSELVLLMIDSTKGVTEQDAKIGGYAHGNGKSLVILVSKWDEGKKIVKKSQMINSIRNDLSFLFYAPVHFISSKDNLGIEEIYDYVDYAHENYSKRVTTGVLNDIIADAVSKNPPASKANQKARIYYASQVATEPPSFILFVNDPDLFHFSYLRYLENEIRSKFDFTASPIWINLRKRN